MRLGDSAPNFAAKTSKGDIDFHAFKKDSWAILFSHPEDFTPVCTTELGAVARLSTEFDKRGIKTIGLSCNTAESHLKWIEDIDETQNCKVNFPIIEDVGRKIATLYDMLDHQDASNVDKKGLPLTVRSVFIIDKKNIIRLMITYPASCGRNFDEVLRVIDALQLSDRQKVVTPANWKATKEEEVIIHTAVSNEEAAKLFPGFRSVKPYLRFTKLESL